MSPQREAEPYAKSLRVYQMDVVGQNHMAESHEDKHQGEKQLGLLSDLQQFGMIGTW